MIVTVTLNAAIDRTLVVPNFQPGHRHRASAGFQSAGGKGINVARALKRLGVPVVCTGLAGGRTGTRLVEELTGEGILNDFVRIRDESRTSIAVLDPTANAYSEINEWGPRGRRGRAGGAAREGRVPHPGCGVRRSRRLASAPRRRRLLRRARARARPAAAPLPSSTPKVRRSASASRPSPIWWRRTAARRRRSSATSSSTRRTSLPGSTRSLGWAPATP